MVEVAICRGGEFKRAEADVIEGLVVNTEGFVCVFNQLMDGEGCIVRLHHSVGHLSDEKKMT